MSILPGRSRRNWSIAAELAKAVAGAIPGATYEEIHTGHYMAVQTPDLIFDRVSAFLRAVGS